MIVWFQDNACYDEEVLKYWVCHICKPEWEGGEGGDAPSDGCLLYSATETVKTLLLVCHTDATFYVCARFLTAYILCHSISLVGCCSILVQPTDRSFNIPFNAVIDRLVTKHLEESLDADVKDELTASQQQVLITKCVRQAWEEMCANCDMVIHSFWDSRHCCCNGWVRGWRHKHCGFDGYQVVDCGRSL